MFLHSRFVAIDDKPTHLTGIKEALDKLRLDCHTKLYEEEAVGGWHVLPGTRILFIDKNLRAGVTMGGGDKNAFSAIAEVIQKIICPDSGPYGLILWAEEPELEALKKFLFERLSEEHPKILPVFCEQLRKGDYINTVSGAVINHEKFKDDILAKMSSSPQMKALFSWEADVTAAMDAVLRSVVDLVPFEKRASNEFGSELGKALYRLSQAGSGIDRATENPREAINRVLVPILADRITEHDPQGDAENFWTAALVEPESKSSALSIQAVVNTAIHLSFAKASGSIPVRPTDLGAVVEYPYEKSDDDLSHRFGISLKDLRDDVFGVSEAEWRDCKMRLIQIGASCDHAQPKKAPLLYLLAIEWLFAKEDGTKDDNKPKLNTKSKGKPGSEFEWHSPIFCFEKDARPGKLSVFKNLSLSVPKSATVDWVTAYRIREELISELTQEYARYISRPGVVTLA